MKTIHKYDLSALPTGVVASLHMPQNAQLLSVQMQNGKPMLWVLIDTAQPHIEREILIVGTGWKIEAPVVIKHIDTVQVGAFVWHYFDCGEV